MKTNPRRLFILAMAAVLAISLTACGGHETKSSDIATQQSERGTFSDKSHAFSNAASSGNLDVEPAEDEIGSDDSNFDPEAAKSDSRKMIITANVDAETEDYDGFMQWLDQSLSTSGGYIETSDMYSYSGESRSCQLRLRIPDDKLDGFMKQLDENCNVLQKSTQEEDVTLSYVDAKSHQEALRTEQTRLLALLEQAESLEDIMLIEDRLTQVRYELERYESILRTFDNQINYSTVNMYVREVVELTEPQPETFGSRAMRGMRKNAKEIGLFFQDLALFVITHLPFIMLLCAIALVVLFCSRKRLRQAHQHRKQQREILQSMKESEHKDPKL